MHNEHTYLMLLSTRPQARLLQTLDRVPPLLLSVQIRDIVVLALQRLARRIFALPADFSDASRGVEHRFQGLRGQTRVLLDSLQLEVRGQIVHERGQRRGSQAGICQLVDDMIDDG